MGNLCSRMEVAADDLYSRPWKPDGGEAAKNGRRSDGGYEGGASTPGGGRGGRRGGDDAASPPSVAGGGGVLLSSPTSARRRGGGGNGDDDGSAAAGPSSPEHRRQQQTQPHRGPPASWTRGELIGAGAFGRVYLGLDDETGELFAVKTVSLPSTVSFAGGAAGGGGGGASSSKMGGGEDDDGSDGDFDDDDDDDFADLTATGATAGLAARRRQDDRRLAPHVEALRSEVELLAGLDHPNIVRYLGTEQRAALPEGCSSGAATRKRNKGGGNGGEESGDESEGDDGSGGGSGGDSPSGSALRGKKASASSKKLSKKKSGSKGSKNAGQNQNLGSELNIFLEYVPGGSIAGLVSRFGALAERVSASYARQILTGLAYLHAHGIAHRDVKGANCLVGSQGVVKLADFGASKRIEDVATLETGGGFNSIKGTPYWMAPEVIKQTGAGRAADVWSVGCTVIEMVTGRPPWSERYGSQVSALFAIAQAGGPPPLPATLSVALRDFLGHCLRRDPGQRPPARALLDHPWITGESLLKTLPPEDVTPLGVGAASLRRNAAVGEAAERSGEVATTAARPRQLRLGGGAAGAGQHRRGFSSGAPSPVFEEAAEREGDSSRKLGGGGEGPLRGRAHSNNAEFGPLGGGSSSRATTTTTTSGNSGGNSTSDGNVALSSPARRSTAAGPLAPRPWGEAAAPVPVAAARRGRESEAAAAAKTMTATAAKEKNSSANSKATSAPAAAAIAAFANDDVLLATVTSSAVALPLRRMMVKKEEEERKKKGGGEATAAATAESVAAPRKGWAAVATQAQAAAAARSSEEEEREEDPVTPTGSSEDEEGDESGGSPPPATAVADDPLAAFEALRRHNAAAAPLFPGGGGATSRPAQGGWAAASLAAVGKNSK